MKFRIILKAFNSKLIHAACEQIKFALVKTNCIVAGHVAFPTKIKKFCVIRSPHVNKASREHFEIRIYKRLIEIEAASPLTIQILSELELPYGTLALVKAGEEASKKKI